MPSRSDEHCRQSCMGPPGAKKRRYPDDVLNVTLSLRAGAPEDLDLHRAQVYLNYVERAGSDGAVDFANRYRPLRKHADWLRGLWSRLIAVQHVKRVTVRAEHDFHNEVELLRLGRIRVCGDNDFLIVKNAREGDDALRKAGDSIVRAVP